MAVAVTELSSVVVVLISAGKAETVWLIFRFLTDLRKQKKKMLASDWNSQLLNIIMRNILLKSLYYLLVSD